MNSKQKMFAKSRIPRPTDDWFRNTFNGLEPTVDNVYIMWFAVAKNACGKEYLIANTYLKKHINSNDRVLSKLVNDVCKGFGIEKPPYTKGYCRRIKLDIDYAKRIQHEWYKNISYATSVPVDSKHLYDARVAFSLAFDHPLHDAQYYLNTIAIQKNNYEWDAADRHIDTMLLPEDKKSMYRTILTSAKYNHSSGVIYKMEKNRFYSVGASIQNVKSELRKVLMPNAYEIDLEACHLAILANYFNMTDLVKNLRNSMYRKELAHQLGVPYKNLKLALNGTCYGCGLDQLRIFFIRDENARDKIQQLHDQNKAKIEPFVALNLPDYTVSDADRFRKLPIVQELQKNIRQFDRTTDIWGYDLPAPKETQWDYVHTGRPLAAYCASIEKQMILPIYQMAIDDRLDILVDQHDGLSIQLLGSTSIEDVLNLNIKNPITKLVLK